MNTEEKTDILMVTYDRPNHTAKSLISIVNSLPLESFRLIVVDNGSKFETAKILANFKNMNYISVLILLDENYGLEKAKNIGLQFVKSQRFVDTDNDIIAPRVKPDWLTQLHGLMDEHEEFGAIALRPQILMGVGPIFKNGGKVVENNVCGGSLRMMRKDLVKGWDDIVRNEGRGQEEFDICNKIKSKGFKVGYAKNLWCYHIFGDNWGYELGKQGKRALDFAPVDEEYNSLTCEPLKKHNE